MLVKFITVFYVLKDPFYRTHHNTAVHLSFLLVLNKMNNDHLWTLKEFSRIPTMNLAVIIV